MCQPHLKHIVLRTPTCNRPSLVVISACSSTTCLPLSCMQMCIVVSDTVDNRSLTSNCLVVSSTFLLMPSNSKSCLAYCIKISKAIITDDIASPHLLLGQLLYAAFKLHLLSGLKKFQRQCSRLESVTKATPHLLLC